MSSGMDPVRNAKKAVLMVPLEATAAVVPHAVTAVNIHIIGNEMRTQAHKNGRQKCQNDHVS